MNTNLTIAGALLLSLAGSGCVATHKYVAKTISPVESRVSGTEQKNTDQDKQLADHAKDIDGLSTDLSRTKPRNGQGNVPITRKRQPMARSAPRKAHAVSRSVACSVTT